MKSNLPPALYCTFQEHANSEVQKTPLQLRFFAAVNHNYVHKQGTMKIKKTHKMDRDPPITIHKPWPLESVEEKLCLLKGPLR